jgi:spore germination cell wall hydrolase CwlJ-like protein
MDNQVKLPRLIPAGDQDIDVLFAMLIFGEARGEPKDGKTAVGWVAQNRALNPGWWGKDLRGVILKPWQFSCFNPGDPNREKLFDPLKFESSEVWDECFLTAKGILEGEIPDNTENSDHYFDVSIKPPTWADPRKLVKKIGRLVFYRLDLKAPREGKA